MKIAKNFLLYVVVCLLGSNLNAQEANWWLNEPFRMVQTNLREIDAIDFDIDVYVKSLQDIGANVVLINVGGIVANYYTDLEFQYRNPYMQFDLIEKVIKELHMAGIRVLGRFDFSKLNEDLALKKPEWLYVSVKGENVNYNGQVHTSVNGGYQQEYSFKILSEALDRFPLDGVFFNMIGYQVRDYSNNYHGIDQSNADREAFRKWSGGLDLPVKEDSSDPIFRKYRQFKTETAQDLFYRISKHIKSYGDHIALNTYTHAGIDLYRKESGSSLFSKQPVWEYSASHNVKSTIGSWQNMKVSNAAVHFLDYPARHSSVAPYLTEMRLAQNMIHGAGVDFYCIGRLDNLEDRKVLDNVKQVFQFYKAHEAYLIKIHSEATVLMLHDGQTEEEYRGIFEFLSENHIQFDVMEHWRMTADDLPRPLSEYTMIILPGIERMSEEACTAIDLYVQNGGKILATGFTSTSDEIGNPLNRFRLESLGVEPGFQYFKKTQGTYFRIFPDDKYELKNDDLQYLDLVYAWEDIALCQPKVAAQSLLGFIPPAMIGPPEKCYYTEVTDVPGIVSMEYGKGSAALITFPIGTLYHKKRHYGHNALMLSTMHDLLGYESEITTDAIPLLELTYHAGDQGKFDWFGYVNHTGQLGYAFHEPVSVPPFSIHFKPEKDIKAIRSLSANKELEYSVTQDGGLVIRVDDPDFYDVVLVEYND